MRDFRPLSVKTRGKRKPTPPRTGWTNANYYYKLNPRKDNRDLSAARGRERGTGRTFMTAILILGLFTAFQESGSPPVAAGTGMIHGVLVDTKRGEVAFTAEVRHPTGKPCIDAWGQRVQAFVGTAVAGGRPTEYADHFVFLAEVSRGLR